MDDYDEVTRMELPPAPRSLWDFVDLLAPVMKYYVVLFVMYLGARWFNQQLDNEADQQEREAGQHRPTLSPELIQESSSEEEEEEEEEIEELVTDGSRLVSMGTNGKPAAKKKTSKSKNAAKELFDGLKKVEEELRQKKEAEDEEDNVSWNELHMSMLRRYKDKYPEHGPRVADPETDKYDEEFNELLRKHNIDPDDLKTMSAKKTE
ncbi:hypothetical protein BBJ29_002030 [Phytophthora kernoviae]|uniref:Uncharacterized protein n=1 Tax=Phytophthora kernoviae TaxID=325452 RepID=A0A3F2RSM1_9STRA|nr:hypothetical protein BBJ29_002030 [Phytophthora kernoviae]RLN62599.1 hypothetical protein BBP00_00004663 [Phytophthora kernoviae]